MILESHTPSEKSDKKSNSCNYLDIFESEILQSLTSYMGYVWYYVCKDQVCYSTSQVLKKIKIVARISTWMAVIMMKIWQKYDEITVNIYISSLM